MRLLISALFLTLSFAAFSQNKGSMDNYATSKKALSLQGGFNYFTFPCAEIGLGIAKYLRQSGIYYAKYKYLGSELIYHDSIFAIAPKIGYWLSGGSYKITLGASALYLIGGGESSLKLRPEIGIGIKRIRAFGGYNFSITNKDFFPSNTFIIGVQFLFDIYVYKKSSLGVDPIFQQKRKNKSPAKKRRPLKKKPSLDPDFNN